MSNKDNGDDRPFEKKDVRDLFGLRKRRFIVTLGGGGILLLAILAWMVFKP